ncbi:hypothetical protein [Nostoc sp.]|uniref:hypothetical protein n=1 Tax=Nostoc sp. TaxID=1180 RepID=UPI002FFD0C32
MQEGFFYDFSNYGVYDRLGDDGLTTWHPAFLALGKSLNECAAKYRGFCKKYKPKAKTEKHYFWGNQFLPKIIKGKDKKTSPGQMRLPWDSWEASNPEIVDVAEKFIFANCYNLQVARMIFRDHSQQFEMKIGAVSLFITKDVFFRGICYLLVISATLN